MAKEAPKRAEALQQQAEEQAGKLAKNARPAAQQASEAIEGGAKQVAEGAPLCQNASCTQGRAGDA